MNTNEREDVSRGLDVLRNIVSNVASSPLAPLLPTHAKMFVDIATASIELAKGLVDAGHEDPVAELHRLRSYVQDSWQTALDKKFSSTR